MPLFTEILTNVGLSKEAAELYESLLSNGPQGASGLAKTTKVKRTYVYTLIRDLIKKGLVIEDATQRKTVYRAQSPEQLRKTAETNKIQAELALRELETALPSMSSQFLLTEDKPVVSIFNGVSGLQEIYEDTLTEGKPIHAVLQTHEVDPTMYEWLTKHYVKKRAQLGIQAKVIVASGKWSDEYTKKDIEEARSTILVPSNIFPFKHEVDIYGNKVAFINYKKGETLIGVVINHSQVADTMRAWFELAWVGAEHKNATKED